MELKRLAVAIIILSNFQTKVLGDQSKTLSCGRRLVNHESLIVNGYESKEGDWPWHAIILHVDLDHNSQYKCGGTLLNSNSILTAAHCVYEKGKLLIPDRVVVQLGRHNLKISGLHSQDFEVYEIYPHPSFNVSSLSNDIAIVRLATEVTFNDYVQPICLWDSNKKDLSEVVGKFGTVVGFGITEKNETSSILRQADIPVVSVWTCLESDRNFFWHFISDSTFCAGFRNGTTACNGDSGGSLVFEENGIYRIRGIVSLARARHAHKVCKIDHYVLFTDVAKYLNWIQDIVQQLPSPSTESPVPKPEVGDYAVTKYRDIQDGMSLTSPTPFLEKFVILNGMEHCSRYCPSGQQNCSICCKGLGYNAGMSACAGSTCQCRGSLRSDY